MAVEIGPISWEWMQLGVDKIRERLERATAALEAAGVPYAVIGGNAVAAWVSRVEPAAVRFTADVDILLRREDLPAASVALEPAGFVQQDVLGVTMFIDGIQGGLKDAVHILYAGEKVRPEYLEPAADVRESEKSENYRVLNLDALVRMKLTSYRRKDQVHIQDLIGVGLIDQTWIGRVPAALAPRLQELLDDPTG